MTPSCSSSPTQAGLAGNCSINSDCNNPLICAFGLCHAQCKDGQRDCLVAGERCVATESGRVCELQQESTCSAKLCPTGLVCGADQQCRVECSATVACTPGTFCLPSGTTSTCYATTNSSDEPVLMAAGILGADGAVIGDGSTVGRDGPTGGGDAAPDSTVNPGADASKGCDGAVLTDGACDYCPAGACANGTCVNGDNDYSCQCLPGYSGTGTKACTISNACVANVVCTPNYPCQPTAPPGLACLGQFASWPMPDAAPGAKVAPRYSGGQDGTVTDVVTTLQWQVTLPTGGCVIPDAGAPDASAAPSCTLAQAQTYCTGLNLGGFSDWRIPTKIELESILDCTPSVAPYLSQAAFPNTPTAGNAVYFWTASKYAGGTGEWLVNFSNCSNYANNSATEADISVRCVRGTGIGQNTAADHYTVHQGTIDAGAIGEAGLSDAAANDTVTDNRTGLTWQRDFGLQMTAPAAQTFCSQLGGFRVPTLKELLTLVDPTRINPAIDPTIFPGTPNSPFWSSTPLASSAGYAYHVTFQNGSTSYSGNAGMLYVRCVQ